MNGGGTIFEKVLEAQSLSVDSTRCRRVYFIRLSWSIFWIIVILPVLVLIGTIEPVCLSSLCRTLNQLPVGRSGQLARTLLRKALRVRSQLSHFCTNFQYYIMFEVLEGAWRSLTLQATQATDLDQLLQAHEYYLATIVTRCLLGEDTQILR